ncbi:hypothetical protein [Streptomyces abikoensis]|uniref:Uncharacterized protein n=1 Tax=Streptomyces abikoensis TaxID=97398 RepID=A0ABW7TC83_9ACTN
MTTPDAPPSPSYYVETMLRSSIEGDRLVAEYVDNDPLRHAETHVAVNGFIAAMAMDALRRHAPASADALAELLDHVFTLGDLSGPSHRIAKAMDYDPDTWVAQVEERIAEAKQHSGDAS